MDVWRVPGGAAVLFNTTRTPPGPHSTGATDVIEMNGQAGGPGWARAPATSSRPWHIVNMVQGVTIAPARTPECSQLA